MPVRHGLNQELPDLLRLADGRAVTQAQGWTARAQRIGAPWLELVYGPLPPRPLHTRATSLHRIESAQLGGTLLSTWRISCTPAPRRSFVLSLLVPPGGIRRPVILSGDACWRCASDAAVREMLRRGYALAQFNRVEVQPDLGPEQAPRRGRRPGAIAAWAWAYMRCVDALSEMEEIDPLAIAVTGHSRGGKAALLAGALDRRITLTHANNSGTGGSGSFRLQGKGSETLAQLVQGFPHWMGPQLARYAGRETEMPFDQHLLKAMIAPRALLTTDALGDAWANPSGCRRTHEAALRVYQLLGAQQRCAIVMRQGGHPMNIKDWRALLDFADAQLAAQTSRAASARGLTIN